jgi:hypothetical protein
MTYGFHLSSCERAETAGVALLAGPGRVGECGVGLIGQCAASEACWAGPRTVGRALCLHKKNQASSGSWARGGFLFYAIPLILFI